MLIGLTGLTGSGKTSAADFFRRKGAFVIDCDKLAHKVIEHKEVKAKLLQTFGNGIFNTDGSVIRRALGAIVFADREKLFLLNGIIHPAITEEIKAICKNASEKIIIIDGSELESSGVDNLCDFIIVIEADEKVRENRIVMRDNISSEAALLRINAQKNYSKEAIRLDNSSTKEALFEKLESVYEKLADGVKQ